MHNFNNDDSLFLRDLLKSGIYSVKFIKVDGSERVMKCTLSPDILPPAPLHENTQRKSNPEIISVWDIENNGWRSFKVANVISVEKI